MWSRNESLVLCCVVLCLPWAVLGGWNETLPGPAPGESRSAWRANLESFRQNFYEQYKYNGSVYDEYLPWTPRSFISPQMMVHDLSFFNVTSGEYLIDSYLDGLEAQYGGIDSVLVWATYPNIGIDNRNQFDLVRDLPGGLQGIASFVEAFHARGVHVLFPYNPWDTGTRDEGKPDYDTIAEFAATVKADGINGDTMHFINSTFWDSAVAAGAPLAMEPEGGGEFQSLWFTKMGWGYWAYPWVPSVDKWKWLESKRITHICARWNWNHTDDIQHAWFNGDGFVTWQNVWGIWNGMTPRNAEATRRVSTMMRFLADFFVSKQWEPHSPEVLQAPVFASRWVHPTLDGSILWTLVNRAGANLTGAQLDVSPVPSGAIFYDVYHGVQLQPDANGHLSFDIEATGYGGVLQVPSSQAGNATLTAFLHTMSQLSATHLASYSAAMIVLPQQIVPIAPTKAPAGGKTPTGMIHIPATTNYTFEVNGIMIETDNDRPGVDFQYPWESFATLYHKHTMAIADFFIDKFPVTNEAYHGFVLATGYKPSDSHNFLKDWSNGKYPSGWHNKPVTWVSQDDARAYCAWAGKRLPHEWEWQYAAQGTTGRVYPWGNTWSFDHVPAADKSRNLTGPDDVDAHPSGVSPFGVWDMVGNVYQWTDEYTDAHTRAASIKGGSYYYPQGSMWYFPQATKLTTHGKYLLMAPSIDRAGTLGFRCVQDN